MPGPRHGKAVAGVSFPLQFCLAFSLIYTPIWGIVSLGLMIFKAVQLPFPSVEAIVLEFIGIVILYILQWQAAELAKKGNLTELSGPLGVGTALQFLTAGGAVYYMRFQTYVMRLDLGFSAALLANIGLCCLLGLFAMHSISNSQQPMQKLRSGPPTMANLGQGGPGGSSAIGSGSGSVSSHPNTGNRGPQMEMQMMQQQQQGGALPPLPPPSQQQMAPSAPGMGQNESDAMIAARPPPAAVANPNPGIASYM
jgi:transmembrane protein 216